MPQHSGWTSEPQLGCFSKHMSAYELLVRTSSCAPTRVPSRQGHVISGSAHTAVKYEVGPLQWRKPLRAAEKRARGDHRSVSEPTPSSLVATPCEVCRETKGVLVSIKALPRQLVAT